MKWYNLEKNKCPKCSKVLDIIPREGNLHCSSMACDFKISPARMAEIINDRVNQDLAKQNYGNGAV